LGFLRVALAFISMWYSWRGFHIDAHPKEALNKQMCRIRKSQEKRQEPQASGSRDRFGK